jgi:subtilisin family serine protease
MTAMMTGRGVRIAVIDSGVHAAHPHVGGIAGGVSIDDDSEGDDYLDRLGHGTAVTAAIKEKAPDAELYAVRVFDRTLSTSLTRLLRAIDWSVRSQIQLVNLSLGTARPDHGPALADAVQHAATHGVIIVSADQDDEGVHWLPGSLPGVLGVRVDWECPRDEFRVDRTTTRGVFYASGYPRPIPGVPPTRNLNGISFAVANMTAFAARVLESAPGASFDQLVELLIASSSGDGTISRSISRGSNLVNPPA